MEQTPSSNPFGDDDPYRSPGFQDPRLLDPHADYGRPPPRANKVGQIRVVSILSMVQGGLELLYGGAMAGLGAMMPVIMKNDASFRRNPPPEAFENFAFWIYFGMGMVSIIVGLLRIVAAIQNYRLRGRILGMVAMVAGVGNIIACYCMPTSIALLIYGLIVYLTPEVAMAFQMRREGHSAESILAKYRA